MLYILYLCPWSLLRILTHQIRPSRVSIMKPCGAILLAGGASSRMGRDKATLAINGITFVEHCIRTLAECTTCIVVASRPGQSLPTCDKHVLVQVDSIPDQGPLRGLHDGLTTLQSRGFPRAVIWPCDCPNVTARSLNALVELSQGYDAAIPKIDGQPMPLNACYDMHTISVLEDFLKSGGRKVMEFCDLIRVRWVDAADMTSGGTSPVEFLNVNTLEDYERLTRPFDASA